MFKINRDKNKRKFLAILTVALGLIMVCSPFAFFWKAQAAGTIAGRVFQDFNGNGTYDTTLTIANSGSGTIGVAIDQGVQNVQVRAYNNAGTNVTTGGVVNTAADGTYSLTTTDVGTGPYRIEFTNLPTGYLPSARSRNSVGSGTATNAGTTVQFASSSATNVNLAVNHPADYSQNNPEVLASLYTSGDQITGGTNGSRVLVSFPYGAGSVDGGTEANFDAPTVSSLEVPANQVGTTYGLAYARKTGLIYAGAFFKRHAGFGPGQSGTPRPANTIYVINRTGVGSVVNKFNVPGTATNSHNTADYPRDNNEIGWNAVGKTSLGGMAISEDETRLYVMNLENRTLYALNAANGNLLTSQAAPTNLPLTSGTCAAADARPFAVTVYRGEVYVGMVCSAESSANVDTFTDSNSNGIWDAGDYFVDINSNNVRDTNEPFINLTGTTAYDAPEPFTDGDGNGVYNLGNANQLRAYVYRVNPTTLAFDASPIFQTALNYRRGLSTRSVSALNAWRPWSSVYRNASTNATRPTYAQPMLTDIAFDRGNLILGLRDRISDQIGNGTLSNPNDAVNTNLYQPRTAGDIIRACGTFGSWTIESNGRCGGIGTAPQGSGEGIGGGEYYFGDSYTSSATLTTATGTTTIAGKGSNHDDTGSGGVEQMPGAPDVLFSNFDPIPNIANMTHDGGIRWLNNTTGAFTKAFRLYDGNGNDNGVFGKAGGIGGNLTLMADPAPIELGNRVWRDTNGNGVQDPNENGIASVQLRLYRPGFGLDGIAGNADDNVALATAVTDANGEYYFTNGTAVDPTLTDNIGIINGKLLYNTAYQIRVDRLADYQGVGPLSGLLLTTQDQTSQDGFDEGSDSDAALVTNPTGSPAGTFAVINVTTGDVGSNNHDLDTGFTSSATYSLGNKVWYDTDNDGMFDATEQGVFNAQVRIYNATDTTFATPLGTQTTDAYGYYRFDGLLAGNYVVRVSPSNFANAAVLSGLRNTTGSNANDLDSTTVAGQNGEDGIDPTGAANLIQTNGIISNTYTLGTPGEPVNESDVQSAGQGAIDMAANMTVDFGFYRLSVGGTLWRDTGAGANNNNGILDAGETLLANYRVQLYDSANQEILVGPDGILGTSDDAAGGMLTNSTGDYLFQGLAPGNYRVVVNTSATSSTPTSTTPNDNINNNDDGTTQTSGFFSGKAISGLVTLTPGNVGALNNTHLKNENGSTTDLTLDFGFVLAPTAVRLDSFNAYTDNSSAELRWTTGEESGNLGFNVYRELDGVRELLNVAPIAGNALRTSATLEASGESYSWTDKSYKPGAIYYLEDLDLNGSATMHGAAQPEFKPTLDNQRDGILISDLAATVVPSSQRETFGVQSNVESKDLKNAAALKNQRRIAQIGGAKISINRDGWYRVSAEQLQAAGFDTNSNPAFRQLYANGVEVPFKLNDDNSIEFYGRGLDNALTDKQVYYLINGDTAGLRIGLSEGGQAGDVADARSFEVSVERKDRFVYSSIVLNGDEENWFGAVVNQSNQTVQELNAKNADVNGAARLRVKLQGATTTEHAVKIVFNDVELGTVGYANLENQTFDFDIPQGIVREGANQVRLQSQNVNSDVSLVDTIRLTYQRTYAAIDNQLRFTVAAGQTARVGGFTDKKISVYEVRGVAARTQISVTEEETDGTFGFSLAASGGDREFIAVAGANRETAVNIERNAPSNWSDASNKADFVIVTNSVLRESADNLAAMREAQNFKTRVVLVDDLFDEYTFGERSPQAIKDFLRTATTVWATKPKYALLFGDASYDSRNRLNLAQTRDLVPTKSVDTEFMETSSDSWLADFNDDGIEDIALGRLPVGNQIEAAAALAKLARYDAQNSSAEKSAVLISDRDFDRYSTDLQSLLPANVRSFHINRGALTDAETHQNILERLNASPSVVAYTGHGSSTVWANSTVFKPSDALNLTNERLGIYLLMTCLNGYAYQPNADSLAESLFKSSNGAIAVWTSSGITHSEKQFEISQTFTRIAFNKAGKTMRVGDAVKSAKAATADADVRKTWTLIGDPTVVLR